MRKEITPILVLVISHSAHVCVCVCVYVESLTIVDGHIDLYTRFDTNGGNLLDNLRRSVQIQKPLVDTHLKLVPRVGTLSRRSLTGGDGQLLGGHADRSTDQQLLLQGTLFEVGTDLFNVFDVARSQSDADAVHHGLGGVLGRDVLLGGGNVCGGHDWNAVGIKSKGNRWNGD